MHLYGGNGKKGRHAANNKHRQEGRPAGGSHIEEERSARVELDYYEEERRERAERRERQARRAESSSELMAIAWQSKIKMMLVNPTAR